MTDSKPEVTCICGGVAGLDGPLSAAIALTPTSTSTNASTSTPRYCTHRTTYHTRSTKSEGDQLSMSSGSVDERDAMDVKLVKIRPQWSQKQEPETTPRQTGSSIVVKKHLVNESLDKYVVLRQKSFHGYLRSREELRSLPLTDPRDDAPESWLHRSKTDLYVEKKFNKKHKRNQDQLMNIDGLNLRNLVETLPASKHEYKIIRRERTVDKIRKGLTTSHSQPMERLPPLTLETNKEEDIGTPRGERKPRPWTDGLQKSGSVLDKNIPHSQRKPLTVPLRVWDTSPSLDFLLVSRPKVLHSRDPFPIHAMMANNVARQQASPLK